MARKKENKFYTVWKGHTTGVFKTWAECQLQIKNFKGCQYKSFSTEEKAQEALRGDYKDYPVSYTHLTLPTIDPV